MDPEIALQNARKALTAYRRAQDADDSQAILEMQIMAGNDLADAFEALDGWITSGGFLPAAWAGRR